MHGAQDITWGDLAISYLLILIPIFIFWYFQTGMIKSTVIAVLRMTVQLLLVGIYLEYIFQLNNAWINTLWVVAMVLIASITAINRTSLNITLFFLPVFLAIAVSVFSIDFYFLHIVLKLEFFFDARYFIPITGMIIGNCMSNIIIALNSYFSDLDREETQYKFALANGATRNEALKPFIKDALQKSLNPTIATTSVVGLISLPGMMTGQILGGSNPSVAIKYQIMIMITILVASCITVILSILASNRFIFDGMDMPLNTIFKKKNGKNT